MSNEFFDIQDMANVISKVTAKLGGNANGQPREEYTKTSYLPDGTHSVTFFVDPNKEFFREVTFHKPQGSKIKCHCPDHLNKINGKNPEWAAKVQSYNEDWKTRKLQQLPACEICKLNAEAKEINENNAWRNKLYANYNHLVYMNLYRTNAPSEYWTPNEEKGTPYAVIGTTKLRKSVNSLLESLRSTSASYITKAINPTVASPPFTITSSRGTQGQVNVSVSPEDAKPPVIASIESPPVWWRLLNDIFLNPEFNLGDYEENLAAAQQLLDTFKQEQSGKSGSVSINKNSGVDESVSNFLKLAETANVPKEKFEIRTQVEDHKPLTTEEVKLESSGELKSNQRLSHTGQIVTLPEYAVERDCWTTFNSSDPLCMKCPANLECALSQE